jgi:hypothetical protein
MLNLEIQKEIESYAQPKIEKCFSDIANQMKNYNYSEQNLNFSTDIEPSVIKININKKISFTINNQQINLDNFNTQVNSPLYDFIKLSNEIINQELSCDCGKQSCNAKLVQLNLDNRGFDISKPVYPSSGEEGYHIEEISTGKKFNFAIRNCVLN